jgi:arsenical pump membrane protein
VGIVVTTFLSNDAAAVVLTPAVFAATRKAKTPALPYLFICAFIANAASFVLPISNPANLVLYADHVPPLGAWLASFGVPAIVSIVVTYAALRFTQRHELGDRCEANADQEPLTASGWTALAGLVVTAIALLAVSAFDQPLGAPTCVLGVATAAAVLIRDRANPWPMVREISWAVLPLVAGLFVLVEALNASGVVTLLAQALTSAVQASQTTAAAASGVLLAVASNLVNNLPAGLITADTLALARPPKVVVDALLIGVDLGPNLSITGSLATILWLTALRREGEDVGFWRFLKVGLVVMPPALLLSIAARLAMG